MEYRHFDTRQFNIHDISIHFVSCMSSTSLCKLYILYFENTYIGRVLSGGGVQAPLFPNLYVELLP